MPGVSTYQRSERGSHGQEKGCEEEQGEPPESREAEGEAQEANGDEGEGAAKGETEGQGQGQGEGEGQSEAEGQGEAEGQAAASRDGETGRPTGGLDGTGAPEPTFGSGAWASGAPGLAVGLDDLLGPRSLEEEDGVGGELSELARGRCRSLRRR